MGVVDARTLLEQAECELWDTYRERESAGLRPQALATLGELIDRVLAYPSGRRRSWVEAVAAEHWGVSLDRSMRGALQLRQPLIAQVILPELLEGYRAGRPHYARWIALFALESRGGVRIDDDDLEPDQLLREALAADPEDAQAAHALIHHLAGGFEYLVHELPHVVLTDDTAAWRSELDEFERLFARHPTGWDYTLELRDWKAHCDAWEEYLRRDDSSSYAEFLEGRGR